MRRSALFRFAAIATVLVAASFVADGIAYEYLVLDGVYEEDWGRMLRVMGFAPFWLAAAIALALHDWPLRTAESVRPALRRAALLVAGVAASGIVGELLKLVFRRERPRAHDGEYFFRSFADRPLHNGGLALPSTHAIVAFGAAAVLSRLFPRARAVFWALAIGCGLTRVLTRAHFVSDIVVAGLVAWALVAWIWSRWGAPGLPETQPAGNAARSKATV